MILFLKFKIFCFRLKRQNQEDKKKRWLLILHKYTLSDKSNIF